MEPREPLDARSLQHVLPGPPPPTFASVAPTSGPHAVGFVEGGVRSGLRAGRAGGGPRGRVVLVQYRPGLPVDDLAALRGIAGERVIVAPNPGIDAPIVATAWQARLRCTAVDLTRLRRFVTEHARAPAAGHP